MELKHFDGPRSTRRRRVSVVLALTLVVPLLTVRVVDATNSGLTSEQVAAEILRVQAQADVTAQRWAEAEHRADFLVTEIHAAQVKVDAISAEYAKLQAVLTRIAIDRFTGRAGNSMILLFGDVSDESAMLKINVLRGLTLDQGEVELDTVDAVRRDLEEKQARLDGLSEENAATLEQLASSSADLDRQLAELAALRENLKDQEVKRAYEAQLAELRQQEAEAAAEREAQAATQLQANAAPSAVIAVQPTGESSQPTPAAAPAPAPAAAPPPAPGPVPDPAPPPALAPAAAPVVLDGSWVCPVAGPNAFGDTWGAPRSGGRSHQGVDMMSPFGTPLVAVVGGTVTMKTNALGGNVVWLTGDDGNKYYYAHLSAWEGGARSVAAGEVIGYVGATGNTTANHLHFEIHPGGGAAINPTPTVRQYC